VYKGREVIHLGFTQFEIKIPKINDKRVTNLTSSSNVFCNESKTAVTSVFGGERARQLQVFSKVKRQVQKSLTGFLRK